MKVYLSGSIGGSYRAQNIIKVLGDSGISYANIPFHYHKARLKNKVLSRIVLLLALLLTAPVRLVMIIMASHVIALPMNTNAISALELLLARVLGKKVIVDYYISEFDTLVNDRKTIKKKSFSARLALFKDRLFMKLADGVIFLNNAESAYYQKVAGVELDKKKIKIIPLCIDYKKELFEDVAESSRRDFNVCWWGTYIPLHGLDNLIRAFSHIEHEAVKLYIFGNSEEKSKPYQDLITSLGLSDKVVVINDCSFSNGKLASFLKSKCDIAIGNFGSSDKAKTVLVNKLVDALSLGLPCLTIQTQATLELLGQNEGLILTESSPERIAESIAEAFQNPGVLKAIGDAGKKKYLELFSPDAFKVKLLEVINE